jgi:hypothetical protein
VCPMPSTSILREVQQLYNVSDRLDSLAEQHPIVSEALVKISGIVRNTATLLEVLVVTKMALLLQIRSSRCLICQSLSLELGSGISEASRGERH